jgi:RNA:NAD 2'-phosphotransferase (TPT1/KptA family)
MSKYKSTINQSVIYKFIHLYIDARSQRARGIFFFKGTEEIYGSKRAPFAEMQQTKPWPRMTHWKGLLHPQSLREFHLCHQ